jgi:hypothetical protein
MRTYDTTTWGPIVAACGYTAERLSATVAGAIGLIGAVIAASALVRATRRAHLDISRGAKQRPVVAIALGMVAVVAGAAIALSADGGLGTGNGIGGAVVAIALGLIAVTLGTVTLLRQRDVA